MTGGAEPQYSATRLLPVVAIPIFLAIANQTMISVALPAIGAELGALSQLPWLVVGYMIALTVAGPVYGTLGDNFGQKNMLLTALSAYILGASICTVAPNLEILACGRLIQGFGGGGLMSLSQALIGQLVVQQQRGKAQGYVATIGVMASTAGPLLGGLLVDYAGWRNLFLFTVPLAVIAIVVLVRQHVPQNSNDTRSFDFKGFVWLNGLVLSWTVGFDFIKTPDQLHLAALALVAGVASLFLLIRSQTRGGNPLFPPRLFAIPEAVRALILVGCHGATNVALITMVPLYQHIVRGEGIFQTSVALMALTVAFGISGILTGNLITWTGRTALFPSITLGAALAGICGVALFGASMHPMALLALYTFIGLMIGGVMAVVHTVIQQVAPGDLRGRAAGSVTFSRSIGAVLGTALASAVLFRLAPIPEGDPSAIAALLGAEGGEITGRAEWIVAFRATFLTIAVFALAGWAAAARSLMRQPGAGHF